MLVAMCEKYSGFLVNCVCLLEGYINSPLFEENVHGVTYSNVGVTVFP